jgi:alpha,alpha-trehalose phosphorylase
MDLEDRRGNTRDGVHIGAMAGTWTMVVYGFAGLRDTWNGMRFSPRLPAGWRRLSFRLRWRENVMQIDLRPEQAEYVLLDGPGLELDHENVHISLAPGQSVAVALAARLEAAVFDLDGVITNTAELHMRAWMRISEELSLPFDRTVKEKLEGTSRTDSLDIVLGDRTGQFTKTDKKEIAARKDRYYGELIGTLTPADQRPGIADLVEELRSHRIPIALASAGGHAPALLERLGLTEAFDAVTDAGALRKGKPDPEPFLAAAEMLGVPPRNCAGIAHAQAGIDAVNAAGMFSVGIGAGLAGARWLCATTAELSFGELESRLDRWRRA